MESIMGITQTITINATPDEIYDAIMSSEKFAAFTGAPATIDAGDGGEFSCFGGQITGRQIENIAGKQILQTWRAGPWPDDMIACMGTACAGSVSRFTQCANCGRHDCVIDLIRRCVDCYRLCNSHNALRLRKGSEYVYAN